MRNLVNRLWLMCCSSMLLITYLLCFGGAITFNSTSVDGLSLSRIVVVENATTNDVRREGTKETIKEDKKIDLSKSVLLPWLPLIFKVTYVKSYSVENTSILYTIPTWNSAFIPSLGANAPPFARC